ncbi:MAG: histidinol dehydrogenase, partial [Parasporobacterium sp.]|nr:histidinol dehydrogenase [Parasporobacterium sp.]
QYIYYTEDEYRKIANDVYEFALKEGLTAHAKSAVIRLDK